MINNITPFNNQLNMFGIGSVNNTQFRNNVTGWRPDERSATQRNNAGLSASQAGSYMSSLKNFGGNLNSITSRLMSSQSVFNRMAGHSTNPDAMLVSLMGQMNAQQASNIGNTQVGVQQLAISQRNTGSALSANTISQANNGNNFFSIERNDGRTFNFNIEVNATDSNRTVQQKMADAINRQDTGITATVQYDERTRQSTLLLTSDETGERHGFDITDGSQGNAVSALGLNNNVREARDAMFTVNGEARTSASNTAELGNGLSVTFRATTTEDATVSARQDSNAINNTVRDLVNNFNQLREAAVDNSRDRGAQNLLRRLDTISQAFGRSLSSIGITQNQNGYWQIDNDRLTTAIENGTAERVLGGNSSVTQRLNQVASAADNNPSQFISRQSRLNMDQTSISENYLDGIRFNAHQQNRLNNWDMIGMLFNFSI